MERYGVTDQRIASAGYRLVAAMCVPRLPRSMPIFSFRQQERQGMFLELSRLNLRPILSKFDPREGTIVFRIPV